MSIGLNFLYNTAPGRIVLKALTARGLSQAAGVFLDSPLSKPLIAPFVKNNNIDLEECANTDFTCFNDCFTRQLKSELRPIDMDPSHLVSPCDGLLSVWPIENDTVLPIKQSHYRISDLLGDEKTANVFAGGTCLVFRLCVNHYHRYAYFDNGTKSDNRFIPGRLHTVRPIALRALPVFTENCREVTLMKTENFGHAAQIEVGAMLVGKIDNYHDAGPMTRGQEKGKFLYGGSTIVVLLEKGKAQIDEEILRSSANEEEYPVKMGEKIGIKIS